MSVTLMEIIKITFHDIVIPNGMFVEEEDEDRGDTISLRSVADDHASITQTVATNPHSIATTLGIR